MKQCPVCKGQFPDPTLRCPRDGALLVRQKQPTEPLVFEPIDEVEDEIVEGMDGNTLVDPVEVIETRPVRSGRGVAEGAGVPVFFKRPTPSRNPAGRVYEPGSIVGPYHLVQLLGEGGVGQVFLAEHTRLGRKVALKILRPELAGSPEMISRFFREARAVNQINHEHIVEITDFVEDLEGESYLIMELLHGRTLTERLTKEGAIPLAKVLSIGIQTCSALAAVHATGIVHRDLKPDNIFLTEKWGQTDFVKLLDFGIVKEIDLPEKKDSPGTIVGTPEYMSPEQARGKEVSARSDLYSIGLILYEMVTGKKPFQAKTMGEYILHHMSTMPPRPAALDGLPFKVPARLDVLIMRCLEKDPEKRPAGADPVREELEAIAGEEGCALEQFVPTIGTLTGSLPAITGEVALAGEPRSRAPLIAIILAFVVAGGLGFAAVIWKTSDSQGHPVAGRADQGAVALDAGQRTALALRKDAGKQDLEGKKAKKSKKTWKRVKRPAEKKGTPETKTPDKKKQPEGKGGTIDPFE